MEEDIKLNEIDNIKGYARAIAIVEQGTRKGAKAPKAIEETTTQGEDIETAHGPQGDKDIMPGAGGDRETTAGAERDREIKPGAKGASARTPTLDKKGRQAKFLRAWADSLGDLNAGAAAAGVKARQHYDWMRLDPEYEAIYTEARQEIKIRLEQEAWRRATGYMRDIVYQGQVTGQAREASDNLLMFALKQLDPSYRDNAHNLIGISGKDIAITFVPPDKPSP